MYSHQMCLFIWSSGMLYVTSLDLISRPGRSQGLVYTHCCYSLSQSVSDWSFVKIILGRCHAQAVRDGAFSNKIDYFRRFKSQIALKLKYWFKRYVDFAEWVDFAYLCSCIGKGLHLQPAQQACFYWHQDICSVNKWCPFMCSSANAVSKLTGLKISLRSRDDQQLLL